MNEKAIVMLFVGFALGAGLVLLMWMLDQRSMLTFLRRKAEPAHRTAVKIGDSFYFIVPAREYVATRAQAFRGGRREWWEGRPEFDQSTRGAPLRPGT